MEVCTGIDTYQNQTYTTYTVNRVHLQPTEKVIKAADNSDQQLNSILFVDMRHSTPSIDWAALHEAAHSIGGDMRVIVRGITYTVAEVDLLMDDTDQPHHWEIGLV